MVILFVGGGLCRTNSNRPRSLPLDEAKSLRTQRDTSLFVSRQDNFGSIWQRCADIQTQYKTWHPRISLQTFKNTYPCMDCPFCKSTGNKHKEHATVSSTNMRGHKIKLSCGWELGSMNLVIGLLYPWNLYLMFSRVRHRHSKCGSAQYLSIADRRPVVSSWLSPFGQFIAIS